MRAFHVRGWGWGWDGGGEEVLMGGFPREEEPVRPQGKKQGLKHQKMTPMELRCEVGSGRAKVSGEGLEAQQGAGSPGARPMRARV